MDPIKESRERERAPNGRVEADLTFEWRENYGDRFSVSPRRPVTLNWAPREAIKHKSLYSPTLMEKRYSTTFRTFNSGIRKLGWMVTSG